MFALIDANMSRCRRIENVTNHFAAFSNNNVVISGYKWWPIPPVSPTLTPYMLVIYLY